MKLDKHQEKLLWKRRYMFILNNEYNNLECLKIYII